MVKWFILQELLVLVVRCFLVEVDDSAFGHISEIIVCRVEIGWTSRPERRPYYRIACSHSSGIMYLYNYDS